MYNFLTLTIFIGNKSEHEYFYFNLYYFNLIYAVCRLDTSTPPTGALKATSRSLVLYYNNDFRLHVQCWLQKATVAWGLQELVEYWLIFFE